MATKRKYTSGADLVLMTDEDLERLGEFGDAWNAANAAGDRVGMNAAHAGAEALRAKYNYSGGSDGSEYNPFGEYHSSTANRPSRVDSMEEFTYESAPTYTSKYQDQIDELLGEIMNRPDFSYDPETDPRYQAFRKEYQREGQRATADTMGQYAAMTGGMPSTAATVAAQQAGDYYAAQMADRIPELYQLAYSMYQDEGDNMRLNMDMLTALEQGDYNKYLNLLNQYNNDRAFAYGLYSDNWNRNYQLDRDDISDQRYDMEWNYGVNRDQISDSRYEDETAWNRQQYEDETEYARALEWAQTLAQAGDFSGYAALGYSDQEIANLQNAYNRAMAASTLSGGSRGGGSSSSSSKSSKTSGSAYERMYQAGIRNQMDAYAWAIDNGYSSTEADNLSTYFMDWLDSGAGDNYEMENAEVDMASVLELGYGPISASRLNQLEAQGEIESYVENGKIKFRRIQREEELPSILGSLTIGRR